MSKIALTGNASGTGTLTIAAPSTNTDRTLTLPDEAGTVLTSGTPLSSFPSSFANGITEADQWRLTTDITSNGDITSNLERVDDASFGYIGTGMTESSGVFSFPSTGIWSVSFFYKATTAAGDNVALQCNVSVDGGSSYNITSNANASSDAGLDNSSTATSLVDVTSTSNVKVKFDIVSLASGTSIRGNTGITQTGFTFIRLGDT